MSKELRLKAVEKEDVDFMHQMRKNPDIMEFWCAEAYTSKERLLKEYEDNQKSDTIRQFIIYDGDQKIGYTSLFNINPRHRSATFAIMLDPSHHGKGYATRSTELVVKYGFNQLNLNKISLDVVDYNEKAIHIYKKVGFEIEGERKQQYFIKGAYTNGYVMGLLRENFNQ
ncbi:GNAT family N-acetyltransferase [Marinilactibacillus sp. XAAS-LB27]|uniref:GNAT family N-acetyltransferase n=1 Tax=Marinilactibacillus sp. XAAS-LB27 TaxID=3114538 RepID=UPI002E176968|nr:GNAT family N-acetyltransferase [Marinilactibacillus sp. XAAS-LB27]